MTRPGDIPAETWEAATDTLDSLLLSTTRDGDISTIARSILAAEQRGADRQREADAEIADLVVVDIDNNPHDFGVMDQGGMRAAEKIAAAIRNTRG